MYADTGSGVEGRTEGVELPASGSVRPTLSLLTREKQPRMSPVREAPDRVGRLVRRAVNVLLAATGLVLLSPLLAVIAVAVKLDSPGPVLYRQRRVGRTGGGTAPGDESPRRVAGAAGPSRSWSGRTGWNTFVLFKFRSMIADAEAGSGPVWSSADDQRVTRVGRWLRRLHLDELPQLWNVLRGDMNLVGPRPERPAFVESLAEEVPGYIWRLRVRPGLAGLAQLRQGSDRTLDDVKRKLEHDLRYIRERSALLDLKIIAATPLAVALGRPTRSTDRSRADLERAA